VREFSPTCHLRATKFSNRRQFVKHPSAPAVVGCPLQFRFGSASPNLTFTGIQFYFGDGEDLQSMENLEKFE
jgi:hypothetical protein